MRTDMANATVQVPTDVTERYHAHERVIHEFVESKAGYDLWCSKLSQKHRNLPDKVRFHVLRDGEAKYVLIPERDLRVFWDRLD